MNESNPTAPSVHHNAVTQRFELVLEDHRSELAYVIDGGRVTFSHTFVPPALRGRGVAEQLVRAALAWARVEKKHVVPACSYVAKFITTHPEFRDLLAD